MGVRNLVKVTNQQVPLPGHLLPQFGHPTLLYAIASLGLSFLIRLHSVLQRILIYRKPTLKKNSNSCWPPRAATWVHHGLLEPQSFLRKAKSSISMASSLRLKGRSDQVVAWLVSTMSAFRIKSSQERLRSGPHLSLLFSILATSPLYLTLQQSQMPRVPCGHETFHSPVSMNMILPFSGLCFPLPSVYFGASNHHSHPCSGSIF